MNEMATKLEKKPDLLLFYLSKCTNYRFHLKEDKKTAVVF